MKKFLTFIFLILCFGANTFAGSLPEESVYQLADSWLNQETQKVTLKDLAGKPRVLAMFYTHCPSTCLLLVAEMKRLERALSARELKEIGFVLVSLDAQDENSSDLKEYAKRHHLNNWTLLTGPEKNVRQLSALLDVKYKKRGQKDFDHSLLITVLDTNGVIVYQQGGTGNDLKELLKMIKSLVGSKHKT